MSLDVHNRNPLLMWAQVASDYNIVTPAQRSTARKDFLNFNITEDETHLEIKQKFNELLRRITVQRGVVTAADQLQTLLGSLPQEFDMLRETYFSQTPAPNIDYIWDIMFDIETTLNRRLAQSGVDGMRSEGYFRTRGRGGGTFRGRSKVGTRGGGSSRNTNEVKSENCCRCGDSDHWSRECPKKDSVCNWCGAVGHIERACYNKANGSARGGKIGGERGRGSSGRGRGGGGYSGYGEEDEDNDQGHAEVLVGEVCMGTGDGDGVERERVCDSGADYHMSGDTTHFDSIQPIPSKKFVKQIMGRVAVTQ